MAQKKKPTKKSAKKPPSRAAKSHKKGELSDGDVERSAGGLNFAITVDVAEKPDTQLLNFDQPGQLNFKR